MIESHLLPCSGCGLSRLLSHYSKNQARRGVDRRCKSCVEPGVPVSAAIVPDRKPPIRMSLEVREASARVLLKDASCLVDQAELAAAVTVITQAIAFAPHMHEVHIALASTHARRGDLRAAEAAYVAAVEIAPANAQLRVTVAKAQISAGAFDSARASLQAALRLDDSCAQAMTELDRLAGLQLSLRHASALLETDEAAAAIEALASVFAQAPLAAEALALGAYANALLGDWAKARSFTREAVGASEQSAFARCALALVQLYDGSGEAALRTVASAVEAHPSHGVTLALQARLTRYNSVVAGATAALSANRYAEAVELLSEAIACDAVLARCSAGLFVDRGQAYKALDRLEQARADFVRATELNGKLARAFLGLGEVLGAMALYAEAVAALETAASLDRSARVTAALAGARLDLRDANRVNPYKILGVARNADDEEIAKAYKRKAREHHPDKGGTEDAFKLVQLAKAVLTDATKRALFDEGFEAAEIESGEAQTKKREAQARKATRNSRRRGCGTPGCSCQNNYYDDEDDDDDEYDDDGDYYDDGAYVSPDFLFEMFFGQRRRYY